MISVSYTHLDVYKRQAYHRGGEGEGPGHAAGDVHGTELGDDGGGIAEGVGGEHERPPGALPVQAPLALIGDERPDQVAELWEERQHRERAAQHGPHDHVAAAWCHHPGVREEEHRVDLGEHARPEEGCLLYTSRCV